MDIFAISPGDKLELRPQLSDGSFSSFIFFSQIQDLLSENEFLIFPLNKDDLDTWLGRIFQITVVQTNKIYISTAKVENTVCKKAQSFLQLLILENFECIQRREYYRLKTGLETEIAEYGKFRTVNISGNGMAFVSDKKIEESETIKGTVDLRGDIVEVSGTVVRCLGNWGDKNLVCVKFKDVEKEVQEKIVKFIYKEQRIMMEKGVLFS